MRKRGDQLSLTEQSVLDTLGRMFTETGAPVTASKLADGVPPDARPPALAQILEDLQPVFVRDDPGPAGPMFELTLEGWLRSTYAKITRSILRAALDALRALVAKPGARPTSYSWDEIAAAASLKTQAFPLATRLLSLAELNSGGSGDRWDPSRPAPFKYTFTVPHDLDEIVEHADVDEFIDYRRRISPELRNVLRMWRQEFDTAVQFAARTIYEEFRNTNRWPAARLVDVRVRKRHKKSLMAIAHSSALIRPGNPNDDRSVASLTFAGLYMIPEADQDRQAIVKLLSNIGHVAQDEAGSQDVGLDGLAGVNFDDAQLQRVLSLIDVQRGAFITRHSDDMRSVRFSTIPGMIEYAEAECFEDVLRSEYPERLNGADLPAFEFGYQEQDPEEQRVPGRAERAGRGDLRAQTALMGDSAPPAGTTTTSLALRREILEELYKLDAESPGASGLWHADPNDPLSGARAREATYLKEKGFVSGTVGGHGDLALRLTASGRDYVEAGGFWSTMGDAVAASPPDLPQHKLPRLEVTYHEKLGSGAFGTVWRGTDVLLERDVAVKFLTSTEQALDEAALLREARSLAKVTHANLVRVYTAAWLPHPDTGLVAPAITMELLSGEVLHTWWARQHSRGEALLVISGILSGVQAMHDLGLHHGDLHAHNVMVLVDGSAKIIDWRYQDTFLEQSTAHRHDLIEMEERRAIDLVVSVLERQGLTAEVLRIRGRTEVKVVATMVAEMMRPAPVSAPVVEPTGLSASDLERERVLQLRKLEAEARIVGQLRSTARHLGVNDPEIMLQIENMGRSGFSFDSCEWQIEWNERFQEQIAKYDVHIPLDYEPPRGVLPLHAALPMLPAGRSFEFKFRLTRLNALDHFKVTGVEVPGFSGNWANYHFTVRLRGELGGEEMLQWVERPTGP